MKSTVAVLACLVIATVAFADDDHNQSFFYEQTGWKDGQGSNYEDDYLQEKALRKKRDEVTSYYEGRDDGERGFVNRGPSSGMNFNEYDSGYEQGLRMKQYEEEEGP